MTNRNFKFLKLSFIAVIKIYKTFLKPFYHGTYPEIFLKSPFESLIIKQIHFNKLILFFFRNLDIATSSSPSQNGVPNSPTTDEDTNGGTEVGVPNQSIVSWRQRLKDEYTEDNSNGADIKMVNASGDKSKGDYKEE